MRRPVTRRAAVASELAPAQSDGETHGEAGTGPAPARLVELVGYAPIVRLDAARREIELCATSEAVDSYGTIFDYEASKNAFSRWMGNVREMHERKAVGQRVGVRFDDGAKKVFVTIRISRGAQDTWEKVLDGTLRGASIGASNVAWQRLLPEEQRHTVMKATKYDLVELSLVDNPSNPDALGITFVRDAAPDLALLDRLEEGTRTAEVAENAERTQRTEEVNHRDHRDTEEQVVSATGGSDPEVAVERAGSPTLRPAGRDAAGRDASDWGSAENASGAESQGAVSGRLHAAARAVLAGCGCALCAAAMAVLDEAAGEDGMSEDGTNENGQAEVERGSHAAMSRVREAALARALGASLRASAGRLERLDAGMRELRTAIREAMREGVGRMSAQVNGQVSQVATEMTRATGDLGRRLERLEAQPMPGGPAARPVEKTHALHEGIARRGSGPAGQPNAAEQYRALEALAGRLADPQAQIAVAAELIRLQREGAGG